MCWIAIAKKKNIISIFENQKDRGLDSIWLINFQTWDIFTAKKDFLMEYEDIISKIIDETSDELCFFHNRKASVWEVTLENSHPFIWDKFILSQNWTSKEIFNIYWDVYNKDTDSETLLCLLEDTCTTLEECIQALDQIDEALWTIIMFSKGRILIYSDSTRCTFVEISNKLNKKKEIISSTLDSLTNYKPTSSTGYSNWFYIICDAETWLIELEWSYDEVYNKDLYTTIYSSGWDDNKKTFITKTTKKKASSSASWYNPEDNDNYGGYMSKAALLAKKKREWRFGKKKWRNIGENKKKTDREIGTIIANLWTVTNNFYLEDIQDEEDALLLIDEYSIAMHLNHKSKWVLVNQLLNIIWGNDRALEKVSISYLNILQVASNDVFNIKTIPNKTLIDRLFFVPMLYLIEISPLIGLTLKLNLIRHTRIINELSYWEHVYYFLWLKYFWTHLNNLQYEEEWNHVNWFELSVETHLFLMYKIDCSFNWKAFVWDDTPEGMRQIVIWFILAWYALWLNASNMNLNREVFNKIIAK